MSAPWVWSCLSAAWVKAAARPSARRAPSGACLQTRPWRCEPSDAAGPESSAPLWTGSLGTWEGGGGVKNHHDEPDTTGIFRSTNIGWWFKGSKKCEDCESVQTHWLSLIPPLLGRDERVLVDGLDHVLKLDPRRPGPAVVDDWLPRSFPAVHWVHAETHRTKIKRALLIHN